MYTALSWNPCWISRKMKATFYLVIPSKTCTFKCNGPKAMPQGRKPSFGSHVMKSLISLCFQGVLFITTAFFDMSYRWMYEKLNARHTVTDLNQLQRARSMVIQSEWYAWNRSRSLRVTWHVSVPSMNFHIWFALKKESTMNQWQNFQIMVMHYNHNAIVMDDHPHLYLLAPVFKKYFLWKCNFHIPYAFFKFHFLFIYFKSFTRFKGFKDILSWKCTRGFSYHVGGHCSWYSFGCWDLHIFCRFLVDEKKVRYLEWEWK